jgi:ABC-type lipoprotein export system ATPase subunit
MITRIKVDGFKSLNGFELDIHPGLNILVGPNGGGKTNVILFFEFLSNLVSEDLHNAVTKAGGAGSIFRKIGERDYTKYIKGTVEGTKLTNNGDYLKYRYSFSIGISFDKDFLFFQDQSFGVKVVDSFYSYIRDDDWDLLLRQGRKGEQNMAILIVEKINLKYFKPRFIDKNIREEEIIETVERYFEDYNVLTVSLFQTLFSFGERNYGIIQDFQGGETFNIIPSKVKQPEDSANPAGIKKDGSGLANTLYAMKKSRNPNYLGHPFYPGFQSYYYGKDTLEQIITNVKLANPSILNIDVSNDPFNNQLIVKVYIKGENDATGLPLSAMSDGTIKWITLITAILTSRAVISIEEPENFLHPWMQAEIVNIMRNTFSVKEDHSFILMTTHSETLLNYANPSELIIISLKDGKTIARRLEHPELIDQEIRNTGFGLGYFYITNALNHD